AFRARHPQRAKVLLVLGSRVDPAAKHGRDRRETGDRGNGSKERRPQREHVHILLNAGSALTKRRYIEVLGIPEERASTPDDPMQIGGAVAKPDGEHVAGEAPDLRSVAFTEPGREEQDPAFGTGQAEVAGQEANSDDVQVQLRPRRLRKGR